MDLIEPVRPETIHREQKRYRIAGLLARFLKPGLRAKLLLLAAGVSLASILAATFLLYNFQRRQLIDNARSSTAVLSSTIAASIQHAMHAGDLEMVAQILQAVAAEEAINRVSLLDPGGVVAFSSDAGAAGNRFDPTGRVCQGCHTGRAPPPTSLLIPAAGSTPQFLLDVKVIENQPECQACHLAEAQPLGLLVIETPLTGLHDQLTAGFWRTALMALASFSLLIGLLIPALDRQLLRPIRELSAGMAQIRAGSLDHPVQIDSRDELGDLAGAFEAMRLQQQASNLEMQRREHGLAILNEVGVTVTQLLDLQEVLEAAVEVMVSKFGMASVLIHLRDEATGWFTLRASRGVSPEQIAEIDRRRRAGLDLTREVGETGQPMFVADMSSDVRFQGLWDDLPGRAHLKLPLLSRGTIVGVMGLFTHPGQVLSEAEVEFLKAAGWEFGIAIDNALLLAETQQREQQAMTLYRHGTRISASLALDDVLEAVAVSARELFDADVGLVGLVDEARQEVVIEAVSGQRAEALQGSRIPVGELAPGRALAEGRPVMVAAYDPAQPGLHDPDLMLAECLVSFLAAPLLRGERFLGFVEVMTRQPRRFREPDALLLMRLAHHVVVSIENAQLYRQLRFLATLEERDRLAREMHDNLAQALGYLKIKAAMTDELLSTGQAAQAQESLGELKKVAHLVYTDVRESIFNLRTPVSSRTAFLSTLQDYLADYRAHYALDARLVVEREAPTEFFPEVATQLLRIIQEALTNVRKHSGASRAWVRYDQAEDQVRISIEDNGRGFDPEKPVDSGRQCYGLQIMRERAESIGGGLALETRPGQGARVIVWAPFLP